MADDVVFPDESIAGLNPAYFALVMATGIVSIAAHIAHFPSLALALFVLNCVAYSVLSRVRQFAPKNSLFSG